MIIEWVSIAMGDPQARWLVFAMENPTRMDDLGGTPPFKENSIYSPMLFILTYAYPPGIRCG